MTLFDQLMTEYTDDVDSSGNVNGGTDGYTFGPGEMVDEFYEGTKALGEGEISQPVQSQYGYHIILRLSADNEAGYDKYASDKDAGSDRPVDGRGAGGALRDTGESGSAGFLR